MNFEYTLSTEIRVHRLINRTRSEDAFSVAQHHRLVIRWSLHAEKRLAAYVPGSLPWRWGEMESRQRSIIIPLDRPSVDKSGDPTVPTTCDALVRSRLASWWGSRVLWSWRPTQFRLSTLIIIRANRSSILITFCHCSIHVWSANHRSNA